MSEAAIETLALTKRYGRARGIEDLTFRVEQGEVFGFLGPNGAGKTTTIRTLLGPAAPDGRHGAASSATTSSATVSPRARRTGFLPGDFAFDERVTRRGAARPLRRPARGRRPRLRARRSPRRFGPTCDRPLGELSRGNRQKIGLVQALAAPPAGGGHGRADRRAGPARCRRSSRASSASCARPARPCSSRRTTWPRSSGCATASGSSARAGSWPSRRVADAHRPRPCATSSLRFDEPVDPALSRALPGVQRSRAEVGARAVGDRRARPTWSARAAAHRVLDMEIGRPSLEETFAAYYGATPRESADELRAPPRRRRCLPRRARCAASCRWRGASPPTSLRRQRLAPLVWGLPLGLMAVMVWRSSRASRAHRSSTICVSAYPDALKEALGISDASFWSIEGYMRPRSSA